MEQMQKGDELFMEFFSRFQSGHAFDLVLMWSLTALLFISCAIIIERIYMILFVYSANASSLMQRIQRLILDNNIEEAVKVTNTRKHAVIYQIFRAALVNANRPFDEIQDHIEVAKLSVIPKLQKRMSYLFTIGNVATLIGLMGTVFGLVVSFSGAKHVEASQKQLLLTAGISTALTATFFGLLIAVPCMFFYGFLFNRVNGLIDEIEHYSAKLLMLLRTGSEYFDKFNPDEAVSTQQTPRLKAASIDDQPLPGQKPAKDAGSGQGTPHAA